MSIAERESLAAKYSAKCARRRERQVNRRNRRVAKLLSGLPAFSAGLFLMACIVWAVV